MECQLQGVIFYGLCVKTHMIHSSAFMLAHMCLLETSKKIRIGIWGFITFIAHTLNLEFELSTLVTLAGGDLDIHACKL